MTSLTSSSMTRFRLRLICSFHPLSGPCGGAATLFSKSRERCLPSSFELAAPNLAVPSLCSLLPKVTPRGFVSCSFSLPLYSRAGLPAGAGYPL